MLTWITRLLEWLARLLGVEQPIAPESGLERTVEHVQASYGVSIIERDSNRNARPWKASEVHVISETLRLLGPAFYKPFFDHPLHLWIDRNPGGGGFGHGWLRIGDPGRDISILYRIFLHEGTHASNEYRGWIYEKEFCMQSGLDWKEVNGKWTHPRQQGVAPQPGTWETLPVTTQDVSTAPGEDLAEMVRYFVHSVKNERTWLWPLDLSKPPLYLWDTSPTRFIFIRDHFLALPREHPWYKRLSEDVEQRVAQNLAH
jgi:hypothetical protein